MTDQAGEAPELLARLGERGLRSIDVANMLGVNKGMISTWANGVKRPSPENMDALRRLAEQAGQPPGDGNGLATDLEVQRRRAAQRAESEASAHAAVVAEVRAERAEHERLDGVRREVAQARADAVAIRAEAASVAAALQGELVAVVAKVRRLQELAVGLRKSAHVENWHASRNPSVVGRREVVTGMPVPRLGPLVFKLGRVLAEVGGSDAAMDQLKADQVGWEALL